MRVVARILDVRGARHMTHGGSPRPRSISDPGIGARRATRLSASAPSPVSQPRATRRTDRADLGRARGPSYDPRRIPPPPVDLRSRDRCASRDAPLGVGSVSSLAAASDVPNRRQRVASRGLVRRRRVGSTARRRSAHLHGRPSHRAKTDAVSKDVVGASGSLPASTRARRFTRLTAPRPGYDVSRRSAAADRRATPHARHCWAQAAQHAVEPELGT